VSWIKDKIHEARFQVRNKLATSLLCRCNGIWDTHGTTDTTDFCLRQLVTDLLYGFATRKLRGKWCNGIRLSSGSVVSQDCQVAAYMTETAD